MTGNGPEVVRTLRLHSDVNGIFFTGSTRAGKFFMEYAAQSDLRKIGLELGGKSPDLALSSYRDIEHAARISVNSALFNQPFSTTVRNSMRIAQEEIFGPQLSMSN